MTDVTTLLAGIKTRAEKATEGPWYFEVGSGNVIREYVTDDGNEEADLVGNVEDSSDGSFMAEALASIPRLVAAIEAVAGLHYEDLFRGHLSNGCKTCGHDWPCPTITAVVAALGGGE